MTEFGSSISWVNQKIETAERTKDFLREMRRLVKQMEDDAESFDVHTNHYSHDLSVEVEITATYSSFEEIPHKIVDNQNWDDSTAIEVDSGWQITLSKRV